MSTFDASQNQFNQYHFTVVEMDLPIVTGAASLTTAIELAEPQWYWKLNEETGTVATDTMLNGNLEYESAASTASYNILPSSADAVGSAKNIRGDTTFQIYDPIPPIPIVPNPTDMLHHWTFDTADMSGTSHLNQGTGTMSLTMSGTATTGEAGQVGESVLLDDAVDSYISGGVSDTVFSASVWFKTVQTGSTGNLFGTFRNRDGGYHGFHVRTTATGLLDFYIGDGSGATASDYTRLVTTSTTNDGQWHHVTMTYDNATFRAFVDGGEVASFAVVGGHAAAPAQSFVVGNDAGSGGNDFEGHLDELKYWDRALSAAQVLAVYTADGGT